MTRLGSIARNVTKDGNRRLIWARYGPLLSKQPMIPLYSTLVGILQYSFICGVQFNRVGNFVYSIERSSFRVYMKRDNRHTKQTVAHCRPQVDISSIWAKPAVLKDVRRPSLLEVSNEMVFNCKGLAISLMIIRKNNVESLSLFSSVQVPVVLR